MSSDEDERPPKTLLQPLSHFQPRQFNLTSSSMAAQETSTSEKPYQITFSTREDEIQYTQKLMANCATYDGNPEQLVTWLKETSAFIANEGYPETDHPFIIRHLLIDDALDYYQAHEDIIFNFFDLRKLFLHKHNVLAPLRTLSSLDSVTTLTLNSVPSILTSTRLPPNPSNVTNNESTPTTFTFAQSIDDLTQHDIRKTIIEDLQRNNPKFTGDQQQDVIKWLKNLESKFDTAGITDAKKFDLISQLLDKGALDWFREHKIKFDHSWSTFVEALKKTFDSPNRARVALQKLTSYSQSPQQDVRSFCSEMRKLFTDADPQMSPTMKLELLLAKVNPSYRLDLLKQKPNDPAEFELMAKDLENTYLVFDAMEQHSQSNTYFPSVAAPISPPRPVSHATNRQFSASSHTNINNTNYRSLHQYRDNPRYSPNMSYVSRYLPATSWNSQRTFQPSTTPRSTRGYFAPRNNPRQNLFAYQPSLSSQQQSPSITIPPLMQISPSSSLHDPLQPPFSDQSASLVCQWCSTSGHLVRDCPFDSRSQ